MPCERQDALANEAMDLATSRKRATRSMFTSASMFELKRKNCARCLLCSFSFVDFTFQNGAVALDENVLTTRDKKKYVFKS